MTGGRKEGFIMKNAITEAAYVTFDGQMRIDVYMIIISLWNAYLESEQQDSLKVFPNNWEFFEKKINNAYDAAMAVSLSGRWSWSDSFVYFDEDGYLTSFSRLDDESCPIDLDKIDIDYLIRSLQDLKNMKKRYVVNNIPKAIHDALK